MWFWQQHYWVVMTTCGRGQLLCVSGTDDWDYLDADGKYGEFSTILERAGMKGLMYAYGDYTCFAPTNEAIDRYVDSNYPGCTLETLPDSAVVALAKSHLIAFAT